MSDGIVLSPFTAAHIPQAVALSRAADWPHRTEDWRMQLDLSHGVVALREGQVVGTALATTFGPKLSFVGMVLVAEGARGQGLGRRLTRQVIAPEGTTRLVATPDGQPLYASLGFVETARIQQYRGEARADLAEDPEIGEMAPGEIWEVTKRETDAFGGERSGVIRWLADHGTLLVCRTAQGQVSGFAALRTFGRGWVVGPVCAEDPQCAQRLIGQAMRRCRGRFVRIDCDASLQLGRQLGAYGLSLAGENTAMQIGLAEPPGPRYALFSQALG